MAAYILLSKSSLLTSQLWDLLDYPLFTILNDTVMNFFML